MAVDKRDGINLWKRFDKISEGDRGQTNHLHYSASLHSYSMDIRTGLPAPHTHLAAAGPLDQLENVVPHFVSVLPQTQRAQADLENESSLNSDQTV